MSIINHLSSGKEKRPYSLTEALFGALALVVEGAALRQLHASFICEVLVGEGLRLSCGDENHLHANDQVQCNVSSITTEKVHGGEDLEDT